MYSRLFKTVITTDISSVYLWVLTQAIATWGRIIGKRELCVDKINVQWNFFFEPSCMNASAQIWLFSFVFIFRDVEFESRHCSPGAQGIENAGLIFLSVVYERVHKFFGFPEQFSSSKWKEVTFSTMIVLFFILSLGDPLDSNQIWPLFVHF